MRRMHPRRRDVAALVHGGRGAEGLGPTAQQQSKEAAKVGRQRQGRSQGAAIRSFATQLAMQSCRILDSTWIPGGVRPPLSPPPRESSHLPRQHLKSNFCNFGLFSAGRRLTTAASRRRSSSDATLRPIQSTLIAAKKNPSTTRRMTTVTTTMTRILPTMFGGRGVRYPNPHRRIHG